MLFLDEHRLCWIKRDGLKAVGEPEIIDGKFNGGGNVEHKPNGLMPNLDNWLYLAKSDKRLRRVNGKWQIEPTFFRGQWGIARDDCGRLYHNHNSDLPLRRKPRAQPADRQPGGEAEVQRPHASSAATAPGRSASPRPSTAPTCRSRTATTSRRSTRRPTS